jgi:hypothetical protein
MKEAIRQEEEVMRQHLLLVDEILPLKSYYCFDQYSIF